MVVRFGAMTPAAEDPQDQPGLGERSRLLGRVRVPVALRERGVPVDPAD
jgi:hypothetical protein